MKPLHKLPFVCRSWKEDLGQITEHESEEPAQRRQDQADGNPEKPGIDVVGVGIRAAKPKTMSEGWLLWHHQMIEHEQYQKAG